MKNIVTYIDEQDRSYGLTGMAISLAVLDNGEKISDIDIDRIPESINFSHEFFFTGNPRCSAKAVWNELTQNFHLSLAMAMGNLLSRKMVNSDANVKKEEEDYLKSIAIEEGHELCGLEADEVDRLWHKDFDYLSQVFRHPAIRSVVNEMASEMRRRRVLTRQEITELLSALNSW